jgi:murein L,D-transpeptidase YcbB/YkuD
VPRPLIKCAQIAAALALAACELALAQAPHSSPAPAAAAMATSASSSPLAESIRERIDHLRYEDHHDVRGARIIADELVALYYESQQFQPAWQDAAKLDELVAAIDDLRNDGLDPTDYHLEALQSYRLDVRMNSPLTLQDRADLDLLATDAFMLGLYHVFAGKVDPVKLSSQWNFSPRPRPGLEQGLQRFSERLAAGEIREAFERARPAHVWYQRGRDRLKEYRAIAVAGGWPQLPEGPTLKPGMSDPRVPVLRQRLAVTNDLAAQSGSSAATADVDVYDAVLEQGVRAFQERHGLTSDGVIGPGTRSAMNVPVAQRIDQIRINLERARWSLHEMKGEFVLVDVAGFYASYFRNDEPVWTSRVIVGKDGRETPVFRSTITYVVFNPTWTIPPGILVKDKLPDLKRNPGALKRMNIRVLDSSGREVNPHSVNWHKYGPGRLPPYQFVQDPGPNNALGLVKIMFPNPYLVYLHDSPAKSLFEEDQRMFSSGCIRVQKPFELAEFVLNDPQWNQQTMQQVIATGETRTVNLNKPVPVLLLYWTAQPRPDGQVIFRNDVYGRDPPTLAALNSDFRLPVVN